MTIFWIDAGNKIVSASSDDGVKPQTAVSGIYDGSGDPPPDTIAGLSPESGRQTWLGASWSPVPIQTTRQKIIARLRADPILKAQVIDSFEARGITDKQQMLAALEAKFADTI